MDQVAAGVKRARGDEAAMAPPELQSVLARKGGLRAQGGRKTVSTATQRDEASQPTSATDGVNILFLTQPGGQGDALKSVVDQIPTVSASFHVAQPHGFSRALAAAAAARKAKGAGAGLDAVVVEISGGADVNRPLILELAALARGANATLIVAAANLHHNDVMALLRCGAGDFLSAPVSEDELRALVAALETIKPKDPAYAPDQGVVMSFLHASGGAGASTLAANASLSLKRLRRNAKVCILDLDFQFGSIRSLLDLRQSSRILDIIETPGRLDRDMLDALMIKHPSGIRVLTAPETPIPLDSLTAETVERILTIARQHYDVVLVDLPTALTRWTSSVLTNSNKVFAVTQTLVPDVHRLQRLFDAFALEGMRALPIEVVANRASRRQFANDAPTAAQIERALGRSIDHFIPNDFRTISSSLNQGAPVCATGGGRYAAAVDAMVRTAVEPAEAGQPSRRKRSLFGGA